MREQENQEKHRRVQTHSECEILRQRQKLGGKDNHKNAVGKINCVRNRVKESRRTTPDYRSNLFTQDLCDVKCNIQMEIIQTTHSSTIYLVAIIIPIGEHRYGLQHHSLTNGSFPTKACLDRCFNFGQRSFQQYVTT